jgi:hypothetical protein
MAHADQHRGIDRRAKVAMHGKDQAQPQRPTDHCGDYDGLVVVAMYNIRANAPKCGD